jgi:hypothetical protein
MTTFANALETVEQLSLEEQESLMDTLGRRLAEKRRAEIVADVLQARAEAASGTLKAATPDEIMRMIRG